MPAFLITLKHEGGYVNDPSDKGGETYQGIARNFHPDWIGWDYLDGIMNKSWNAIYSDLNNYVADFFYHKYWSKYRIEEIHNQDIANLIYDWCINSGGAIREIQKVLNSFGYKLATDNKIGRVTLQAINQTDPINLNEALVTARKEYYLNLVENGNLSSSFLDGLISRADQYKNAVVESVGKPQAHTGRV
jgi:lysozyme family protein